MTTTNQAFINAYRQTSAPQAATVSASPAPAWANIEIATWQVEGDALPSLAPAAQPRLRIDPPHTATIESESPQARRMRRRLSDIAAERERFESRLATPIEPLAPVALPRLAAQPDVTDEPITIGPVWPALCADLLAVAAPSYDTALQSLLPRDGGAALIGVVAAQPGGGCTTTTLCLALRAATLGMRPLVIESSGAGLAAMLSLPRNSGWWSLVERGESPLRAAQLDPKTGVALLPCGGELPAALAPAQLFELATAMGVLRHKHRAIIVDFGSLETAQHAARSRCLVGSLGVDSLLAVTRAGDESLGTVRTGLGPHASKLVGAIATGG